MDAVAQKEKIVIGSGMDILPGKGYPEPLPTGAKKKDQIHGFINT